MRGVRLLGGAALVLAIGAVGVGLVVARDESTTGDVGAARAKQGAPELEGEVLVPPPVRLARLRGQLVVVNFWASWCIPCRKEAPELARFAIEMRAEARLVGVNFQDAKADALAIVREFGWRFPNVRDPKGKLATEYRLVGLPTTYVIDREGRIARVLAGEQRFEGLRLAVEAES